MTRIVAALCALIAVTDVVEAGGGGSHIFIPIFTSYAPPPVPDARTGSYENIHKVGIIFALGTTLPRRDDSKTVAPADISSWHLDAVTAAVVRKYLGGRFEFVDVAVDQAVLQASAGSERRTIAYLKSLPNPGVDAYLLIGPADAAYGPDGIALQTYSDSPAILWANFEVGVIDARSLAYIAKAHARTQTRDDQQPLYPAGGIDGIRTARPGNLEPADLDAAHRAMEHLLPLALVETIRALKFDVTLPPIGDHSIAVPALAAEMARIRTVAVVSAIGDEVRLLTGGHVMTGKANVEFPAAAWGIDQRVEAIAREVLSRHRVVKTVAFDRQALSKVRLVRGDPIREVPGLQPSNDVDVYVVILKATRPQTPFPDLGVLHWTPLLSEETTAVYANYAVVVVDARTLQPIAARLAAFSPRRLCKEPRMPSHEVPNCLIANDLAQTDAGLSEAGQTEVRTVLDKLLDTSIPETLFHLGLDSGQLSAAAHSTP